MRHRIEAVIVAIAIAMASSGSAAPPPRAGPDLSRAAAELRAAQAAVAVHTKASDGFALDKSPGAPALLEAQWAAARRWAATWLAAYPGAAPAALVAAGTRDTGLELTALRLDGAALLVTASADALGTAFLLRRAEDGRYVTALALDEPGTWGGAGSLALAAWRSDHANWSCVDGKPPAQWAQCGPMAASIAVLPPEPGGARRFALVGRYVKEMGATDGFQLSIWRWDGAKAAPLLLRTFAQMADEPVIAAVTPRTLIVHVKGDWRRIGACGSCAGRQSEWRFDLAGPGARLAPVRSLTPDVDLVDLLYDRLFRSMPTADLASPAAVAALMPTVARLRAQGAKLQLAPSLGMLSSWRQGRASPGAVTLCLDTDELDRPQLVTIQARGGTRRITAVRDAAAKACDGPDSHS